MIGESINWLTIVEECREKYLPQLQYYVDSMAIFIHKDLEEYQESGCEDPDWFYGEYCFGFEIEGLSEEEQLFPENLVMIEYSRKKWCIKGWPGEEVKSADLRTAVMAAMFFGAEE